MSKVPRFFTRFDPPPSVNFTFSKPSLTEQSHRKECNINCIIDRYKKTGILGGIDQAREMFFGDFSEVGSFHDVQNIIVDAREKFNSLPSNIREAFGNDPARLLDALRDKSQIGKLIDIGLIKKVADGTVGTPENPADVSISEEQKAAVQANA